MACAPGRLASNSRPPQRLTKVVAGPAPACPTINQVELEKTLLRKVGEAIHRFGMIYDGDRVAVALSGGKDSATLLEALLLLQKRAPIDFSISAFTVEQGKFLAPIEPYGDYLKRRGVAWTYFRDE